MREEAQGGVPPDYRGHSYFEPPLEEAAADGEAPRVEGSERQSAQGVPDSAEPPIGEETGIPAGSFGWARREPPSK